MFNSHFINRKKNNKISRFKHYRLSIINLNLTQTDTIILNDSFHPRMYELTSLICSYDRVKTNLKDKNKFIKETNGNK